MHIIVTGVESVLILLAMAFGSRAFGQRFRLYSIATVLVTRRNWRFDSYAGVPIGGEPADAAGGVTERISIDGYLL